MKIIHVKNNNSDNVEWNNGTEDSGKVEPNNDGIDNNNILHIEIETSRINIIIKEILLVLTDKFPDITIPSYTTPETQNVAMESEYHLITISVLRVLVEYSWNFLVTLENDILATVYFCVDKDDSTKRNLLIATSVLCGLSIVAMVLSLMFLERWNIKRAKFAIAKEA